MKIITYAIGTFLSLLILLGFLFRIYHFPGHNIILIAGIGGFVLIFIPLFIFIRRKTDKSVKKPLFLMLFSLLLISYVEFTYSSIYNVSSASSNSFIMLHNNLENNIQQIESYNIQFRNEFDSKLITLKANGYPENKLENFEFYKNINDSIFEHTKLICNDIVKRNLLLLISAANSAIELENFDHIEEVFDDYSYNNYEAKTNLKAIVNFLNSIYPPHEEKELNEYRIEDEYFNNLFDIDEFGFIHIKNISEYYLKDDLETSSRILVGNDLEHIAVDGYDLIQNLINYRNNLISFIANHTSDSIDNSVVYQYKYDPSLVQDPAYLFSGSDKKDFEAIIDSAIDIQLEKHKLDPLDAKTIKNIYIKLTIPYYIRHRGRQYPWIWQFHHTTLAEATCLLSLLKMNILEAQMLACKLIESKLEVPFVH